MITALNGWPYGLPSPTQFVWWRIIRWLTVLHRWRWKQIRRRFTDHTGRWLPISADGITLFDLDYIKVTRYRYRGPIPNPWQQRTKPT